MSKIIRTSIKKKEFEPEDPQITFADLVSKITIDDATTVGLLNEWEKKYPSLSCLVYFKKKKS